MCPKSKLQDMYIDTADRAYQKSKNRLIFAKHYYANSSMLLVYLCTGLYTYSIFDSTHAICSSSRPKNILLLMLYCKGPRQDCIHFAHLREHDTTDLSNLCKYTYYTTDIDRSIVFSIVFSALLVAIVLYSRQNKYIIPVVVIPTLSIIVVWIYDLRQTLSRRSLYVGTGIVADYYRTDRYIVQVDDASYIMRSEDTFKLGDEILFQAYHYQIWCRIKAIW